MNMNAEKKRLADRFLDELMSHVILAGGAKIEPDELRRMSLGEVVDMCFSNGIDLKVSRSPRDSDYLDLYEGGRLPRP